MSELRAARLQKRYKARTVVHDVSLDVASGEVVGLLGPNGAGKTTCFYMIVGLVPTDAGRIELDGADISGLPMHERARRGIGYLPQEASVFRALSVADNLMAVLELRTDLNAETRKGADTKELREVMAQQGGEVVTGTPEDFGRLIASEFAKWAKAVALAGVKPE